VSVGVVNRLPPGRPKGGSRLLGGQRTNVSVGVVNRLLPGRPKGGSRLFGGQRTNVSVGVCHISSFSTVLIVRIVRALNRAFARGH
jgi:hypothetical protein